MVLKDIHNAVGEIGWLITVSRWHYLSSTANLGFKKRIYRVITLAVCLSTSHNWRTELYHALLDADIHCSFLRQCL